MILLSVKFYNTIIHKGCVHVSHIFSRSIALVFKANDIREKLQAAVNLVKAFFQTRMEKYSGVTLGANNLPVSLTPVLFTTNRYR